MYRSELDKNVVMAWVGSPAQLQMSFINFLEYAVPRKSVVISLKKKKMAEAVTRDMASSDCLNLEALCLLRAQSEPIDHFHKWRPLLHSFVFMLIIPTALVLKQIFF